MCLILISFQQHSDYPFILAANRDEYYKRPTQDAEFWEDAPAILGGRDLKHSGTWLGVDRHGRVAAVTNYREPSEEKTGVISRGLLVSNFLQGDLAAEDYLKSTIEDKHKYDGFNLLLGDQNSLYFFSSLNQQPLEIRPGFYGISNGEFDCPWPKVIKGKQYLQTETEKNKILDYEKLLALLADTVVPDDEQLPDTGIGLQWERKLAPIFVTAGEYGTRASTVLGISKTGVVNFYERNYDEEGMEKNTLQYEFMIEPKR